MGKNIVKYGLSAEMVARDNIFRAHFGLKGVPKKITRGGRTIAAVPNTMSCINRHIKRRGDKAFKLYNRFYCPVCGLRLR